MEAGALEEKLLVGVVHVEADHVGDGEAARIASQKLDGVTGANLALAGHGQIEPVAAALMEALDHAGVVEAHAELVARHARLGDRELRRADAEAVAGWRPRPPGALRW